ncbi:MAG: hypothetical protein ACI828_002423 [Flavobacteriales bacterium]|jgi:hypothetical protein
MIVKNKTMKKLTYLLLALCIVVGCASQDTPKNQQKNPTDSDTLRIANDSLEYEIIIIEPGFNTWLVGQRPRGFYEQFWLENRNIFLVNEYNNRVLNSTQYDPNIYQLQIDYQRTIDYGYEVNYLLYNWLEFFQKQYKQKLR